MRFVRKVSPNSVAYFPCSQGGLLDPQDRTDCRLTKGHNTHHCFSIRLLCDVLDLFSATQILKLLQSEKHTTSELQKEIYNITATKNTKGLLNLEHNFVMLKAHICSQDRDLHFHTAFLTHHATDRHNLHVRADPRMVGKVGPHELR